MIQPRATKIGAPLFLIPSRIDQAELLDQGEGSLADVRTNLQEMSRINRAFAGVRSITSHLKPEAHPDARPLRIVDLGTGSGQLAHHLVHDWARENNVQVQVYPVDLSPRNLSVARETVTSDPAIHLIQANGLAPPFAADCIDYYISSLFMHHFSPELLIELLRTVYQLARRGIIMSDIVRGYLPLAAFRLVQPVFARHFMTRHDGTVSIRRAYTPRELQQLARAAGLETACIHSYFPWRMTLVAEKPYV